MSDSKLDLLSVHPLREERLQVAPACLLEGTLKVTALDNSPGIGSRVTLQCTPEHLVAKLASQSIHEEGALRVGDGAAKPE